METIDGSGHNPHIQFSVDRDKVEVPAELKETAFDRILLIFTSVIFCGVIIFVIMQVVIRFIMVHVGFSVPWTEEAARYLLVMFTFFGSAIAWRRKEHVTITSIVDCFPPKVRLVGEFICAVLILGFLLIVIQGSYNLTVRLMVSPIAVGAIEWMRTGYLYGLMTVSMVLIAVYMVRWIVYYVQKMFRLFTGKASVRS